MRPRDTCIRYFAHDPEAPKTRQQKVVKKTKQKKGDGEGQGDGELKMLKAYLNAKPIKEGPISEEEKARRMEIGRNYVIGKFREHNDLHHDLTCKIRLKQHAIKMLPKNSYIRDHALTISDEMRPAHLPFAAHSPPIPDFDPESIDMSTEEK